MKNRISIFICLTIMAACQPAKQTEQSVSFESLVLDSLLFFDSEQKLAERFGEDAVTRDTAYYPEGMGTYLITVLHANTNKEVEFTWNDTINFSGLNTVTLHQPGTVWKTSEGITIGTSLKELVALNKSEVEFSGLGWDYGGRVSWKNGELQNRNLDLIVDLPEEFDSGEVLDSIMGDQIISSEWAIARRINPVVIEVSLYHQKEE